MLPAILRKHWDKWRVDLSTPLTNGHHCFCWTASKTGLGYGKVRVGNSTPNVHRLVCEATHGPIEGMDASHMCHNASCVHPDHLEWEPPEVNQWRRIERQRRPTPEDPAPEPPLPIEVYDYETVITLFS